MATSSHELRTPLNGILTMLMLIVRCSSLEEVKHYASVAHSTAELMLSLVNDMLDFSTIMMKKFVKKVTNLDVRVLFRQASDLLLFQIEKKGLQLRLNIDERVPRMVQVDGDRLR